MVKTFFKIEFRRICRWQTLLAFIVFIGAYIHISIMDKMDIPTQAAYPITLRLAQSNFFISFLNAFCGPVNSYMALILPLVILLIIGDTLFLDYKTGFYQFSISRMNYKEFIKYKTIGISLVTFIVALIFQLIAFLYSILTSPYYLTTKSDIGNFIAPKVGIGLYLSNPFAYIFVVMIFFSVISMTIAVLGIITSNIFRNLFTVVSIPWLIYIIIGQLLMVIGSGNSVFFHISPIEMFGPCLFGQNYNFTQIFLYWCILWSISSISGYKLYMRKFKLSL
jgi:hypothetical protein